MEQTINRSEAKVLDCSLRDCVYYNNWRFGRKLINFYLSCMSKEVIESGFRFLNQNKSRGETVYKKRILLIN